MLCRVLIVCGLYAFSGAIANVHMESEAGAPLLKLELDDASGLYNITMDGQLWLHGNVVSLLSLSSRDGTLSLSRPPLRSKGADALGSYDAITLEWEGSLAAASPPEVVMRTSFRTYPSDPGFVVFEQHFPREVDLTDGGKTGSRSGLRAASIFPGFARNEGPADAMHCFSYFGEFANMNSTTFSKYTDVHQGGVPLVIYDATAPKLPMLVFSQLNNAKAAHVAADERFVGAGVKATAHKINKGWRQLFILSAGIGINDGMMAWGDRMLTYSGKRRVDLYRDVTHSTIGFWTDNGGYYHYNTGSNLSYEEVLPLVKKYHDSLGVPFRHWQFDSWFYPKDGGVNPGGGGGAVTNWTALPSVFPRGMAHIQSLLKMPMVMHNRQWSSNSSYLAKFGWYKSKCCAIPQDPHAFFHWFFEQQPGWGLAMYEQDWMNIEYDGVEALQTNLTLADDWLAGMAAGAHASGRTVQYCMPYPHDVLAGSAHAAVTNARATGDYFHAKHQWAIGASALFYWALGVLPFKDGFYSSSRVQRGGQTVGPELHPDREIIISVLSGAMVGAMDGIGLLNATRLNASCRPDGYILKPDRPLTTSDACFTKPKPELCFVYQTYTDINGLGRLHYIFMDTPEAIAPHLSRLTSTPEKYAVYNWYTGQLSSLSLLTPYVPIAGYEGHALLMLLPIVQGWVLLGEVDKYVPTSALRFRAVRANKSTLVATAAGVGSERVRLCAANTGNWLVKCKELAFGIPGTADVSFFHSALPALREA